jgi:hypothetical protein
MLLGDHPTTSTTAAAVGIDAVLGVPAPEGAAIPKSGVVSFFTLCLLTSLSPVQACIHFFFERRNPQASLDLSRLPANMAFQNISPDPQLCSGITLRPCRLGRCWTYLKIASPTLCRASISRFRSAHACAKKLVCQVTMHARSGPCFAEAYLFT